MEKRAAAIRLIAHAFRENGNSESEATESILTVIDTSADSVNAWACGIIADCFCDCGCVEGNYPCEYGSMGDGCGS